MATRDRWFSDCAKCGTHPGFDTQDQAIADAEAHVFSTHREIGSYQRMTLGIGTVQNRTETAEPPAPVLPGSVDGVGGNGTTQPVPTIESTPTVSTPVDDSTTHSGTATGSTDGTAEKTGASNTGSAGAQS